MIEVVTKITEKLKPNWFLLFMMPVVSFLLFMVCTLIEPNSLIIDIAKLILASITLVTYSILCLVWFFSGPGPISNLWKNTNKAEDPTIVAFNLVKSKIKNMVGYFIIILTPIMCVMFIVKYYVYLFANK